MEVNVHEAGTGAVRSIDVAEERWDLMSWYALGRVYDISCQGPYQFSTRTLIDHGIEFLGKFLAGQRDNQPLERAAFRVLVAISVMDHPQVVSELQEHQGPCSTSAQKHIPYWGLVHYATTCHEGATKYGEHNWLHGFQVGSLCNHALRHLCKWNVGDRTEDHLGHASWNILSAIHMFNLRPDMRNLLLGEYYQITPEIQAYHDEHASRRRVSKAEASRAATAAALAGPADPFSTLPAAP